MKAIVVTDRAAGTAGMKLVERPEPRPAINDGPPRQCHPANAACAAARRAMGTRKGEQET